MEEAGQLASAIEGAVTRLCDWQLTSGGFESCTSPTLSPFVTSDPKPTTYAAAVTLRALNSVKSAEGVADIRARLAAYLHKQRSEDGGCNYWERGHELTASKPYPDDLDDTAVVHAALWSYDEQLRSGEAMAQFAKLLIAAETRPGGPYRTWLVSMEADKRWHDIDVVVNAAIGEALMIADVVLPNIEAFAESAIRDQRLTSSYYPSEAMAIYTLARWYKGSLRQELCDRIWELRQNGHWSNTLETAMMISSLIKLGEAAVRLRPAVHWLLSQRSEGAWAAEAICLDPAEEGEPRYAGASAITTALCVEALSLYRQIVSRQPSAVSAAPSPESYIDRIWEAAQLRVESLPGTLRADAKAMLQKVYSIGSGQQVANLPYMIASQLNVPFDVAGLRNLALGSVYGWMSYTLADDIVDSDVDTRALPLVMVLSRWMREEFSTALPRVDFQTFVDRRLEEMDAATAWELQSCRVKIRRGKVTLGDFPDYGDYQQLANRSLGHILSGVGVFALAGHDLQGRGVSDFTIGMRHYIIARQLNDDAHDWLQDLRRGQLNSTSVLLLRAWRNKGHSAINLDGDIAQLQALLWQDIMPQYLARTRMHIERSRSALRKAFGGRLGGFTAPLDRLEEAVHLAITERRRTQDFIDNF